MEIDLISFGLGFATAAIVYFCYPVWRDLFRVDGK